MKFKARFINDMIARARASRSKTVDTTALPQLVVCASVVTVFAVASACSTHTDAEWAATKAQLAACQEQLTAASGKLDACASQLASCAKRLDTVEHNHLADIAKLRIEVQARETAVLDPTQNQFAFLASDAGVLAVSVKNVAPLADGAQLTLSVGNLTSASITAGSFHVKWGPRSDELDMTTPHEEIVRKVKQWEAAVKESDVPIGGELRSGAWNSVVVGLPSTKPADVGYLEISMQVTGVALTQ
jgi:hypothetical protein